MQKQPWWQQEVSIAWALILFFPLGLWLMWKYAPWRNRFKWIWTGVTPFAALMIVAAAIPQQNNENSASNGVLSTPAVAATSTAAPQPTPATVHNTAAPEPTSTAAYQLELISGECKGDRSSGENCEGKVKNLTDEDLAISVGIDWSASKGGRISDWCSGLVDDQPLVPGVTSTWHASCTYNSGLTWYGIAFYDETKGAGALLETKDDR